MRFSCDVSALANVAKPSTMAINPTAQRFSPYPQMDMRHSSRASACLRWAGQRRVCLGDGLPSPGRPSEFGSLFAPGVAHDEMRGRLRGTRVLVAMRDV